MNYLENLLSPQILFFILGFIISSTKTAFDFPKVISKALSIYLMTAIGLKGGMELSKGTLDGSFMTAALVTLVLGFVIPLLAFYLLKNFSKEKIIDCIAIAAHYGSTSIATFITAVSFLESQDVDFKGYMIFLLVLLEFPSIFSALWMKSKYVHNKSQMDWRHILFIGTTLLLVGSLIIGFLIDPESKYSLDLFIGEPFTGFLCIFLLSLGLDSGQNFTAFKKSGFRLVAFGLYMPLISAAISALVGSFLGLGLGELTLFIVLSASSSYIVIPAAMKLSLPEANAGIYVPLSLGITFPFNIAFGIPLYYLLASYLV